MAAVASKSMESLNKLLMDDLPMTNNPLAAGADDEIRSVSPALVSPSLSSFEILLYVIRQFPS